MTTARRSRRSSSAVTLHDVAREAGVSPMTVSRVIGGVSTVNDEMRERVKSTIVRIGYSPNPAARRLASGDVLRIGVLYGNPSASFTSQLLVGLAESGGSLGCQLVLEKCPHPARWRTGAGRLIDAGVNGVVVPAPLCDDPKLVAGFEDASVPTVALGTGQDTASALALRIDNRGAAAKMTRHLLAMGHRRIGFIVGHAGQADSIQRREGFAAAMAAGQAPIRPEWIVQGDYSYRSGILAAERLLALEERPTAIFASNDEMAAGALAAAHRAGLDVPRELGIAGFDDTALATTIWPALTTIRQPIGDMAARALAALVDHVRGRRGGASSPGARELVPLRLIERESVTRLFD